MENLEKRVEALEYEMFKQSKFNRLITLAGFMILMISCIE